MRTHPPAWHFCLAVSNAIGQGHLLRCLALRERLAGEPVHLWVWTDWPAERLTPHLQGVPHTCVPLSQAGWPASGRPERLLVDLPDPPAELLAATAPARRRVLLGCRDERRRWADLVVNVAEGGPLTLSQQRLGTTEVWEGAGFALLRPEFLAGRQRPHDAAGPLLLALGGTDAAGLTRPLVEAALAASDRPVWAVLPAWHADHAALARRAADQPRLRLLAPSAEIAQWLQQAASVVLAPGNLLFESLALQAPAVAVAQNPRQQADFAHYPWLQPAADPAQAVQAALQLTQGAPLDSWRAYARSVQAGGALSLLDHWFRQHP